MNNYDVGDALHTLDMGILRNAMAEATAAVDVGEFCTAFAALMRAASAAANLWARAQWKDGRNG